MDGTPQFRQSPSPVEILPVGDAFCVFRPDNHATMLLNAAAMDICRPVLTDPPEDRRAPAGMAPEYYDTLVAAGFITPLEPATFE